MDVTVDGTSVGAVGSYTFSNITASHSITASFAPSGQANITSAALYTSSGRSLNGGSIKSGYGIFATVQASYGDVSSVIVTAQYNFGSGSKVVAMTETSAGVFQFPVNTASTQHNRCIYIPVATADGNVYRYVHYLSNRRRGQYPNRYENEQRDRKGLNV